VKADSGDIFIGKASQHASLTLKLYVINTVQKNIMVKTLMDC